MSDKPALRKEMALRRSEAAGTADQEAARRALRQVLAGTQGPVSFFWPIRTEIDARPVMEALAEERTVCLPITQGRAALDFRRWTPGTELVEDGFGVPIPVATPLVIPAVLVVPMLGFDEAGHRLGYGGGYYDRTLAELRPRGPVLAVGFAFEAQRLDQPLPAEPTDQPLDILVTDAGVRRFEG